MKKQIFLDMDGVIVDWDAGVRQTFGVQWYPDKWEIPYESVFGLSKDHFWSRIDDTRWWGTLPWTVDGKAVYELVQGYEPVILTVARCAGARSGKPVWLRRNLPKIFYSGRYFITGGAKKHYLSHPAAVLIDDCDEYCTEWEAAGGRAILYPRPWNENRHILNPVSYLERMLMEYL